MGDMVALFLVFCGSPDHFLLATLIYIPTKSVWLAFAFLLIFIHCCYYCLSHLLGPVWSFLPEGELDSSQRTAPSSQL